MTHPTPTLPPRTLDEVELHADPIDRARAAVLYLARLDERRDAALRVRDEALRADGPRRTAAHLGALVGVSASVVKAARRTQRRR